MTTRRAFCLAAASLPICPRALGQARANGPQIWRVERRGLAYVFGFGEAKNRSWLTPWIAEAFEECNEL